ncbi:MAG TPA: response regulator transcription factor [Blastocatellia bacterium]|nr:response regulator transcription factor [Blastocatellia bacterium]
MAEPIRLIVADDHPIVRQGLCLVIEKDPGLQIVAEAGDGQTALEQISATHPDIAILDVDMPGLNGFDVARAIAKLAFSVGIIFLTVHCEEEFFDEALELGAKGYVLKDSSVTDIVACIRAVAAGQNYVSPALTTHLFRQRRRKTAPQSSALDALTPTERQVLKLLADYKTSKDIAATLFISPHTVQTHRKNICAKLQLEGNHALMRFALEHKSHL